jgi:diguanylate cyclase (GGDEF)-like protein
MRNIQVVLNAILSKNIFEYILVDRELKVLSSSDGLDKYVGCIPEKGADILEYFPELVGNEEEIKQIFVKRYCLYSLESVYKNEYYVNISIEYSDQDTAIILLHNITAVTMAQQKLLQYSNESSLLYSTLQKVVDNQNTMICVADNQRIEFANQKFMDYFKLSGIDQLKKSKLQIYRYFDREFESYDDLYNEVKDSEQIMSINEDTFLIRASMIESSHRLFTLIKVTELSKDKYIDQLTQAYTKRYFNDMLEKSIEEERKGLVLVIMDLDNFKSINDRFGHQVGDSVLKRFSALVKDNIREYDIFARWGGEEFVLLFKNINVNDVYKKAERLRKVIESYSFGEAGYISCSFGLADLQKEETADSLFFRADKALYKAKKEGKNTIIICESKKRE